MYQAFGPARGWPGAARGRIIRADEQGEKSEKSGKGAKGAKGATLLLCSASSKTAYGTAFQLAQRSGVQVVVTRALATSSNFK